jgi:hypothetical protein
VDLFAPTVGSELETDYSVSDTLPQLDVLPATFTAPPPRLAPAAEPPVGMILTGAAGGLSTQEQQTILAVAKRKGVDPVALAAIRLAENGGAGREFGVLSVQGQPWYEARVQAVGSFQAQAEVAATSLKQAEGRYRTETGQDPRSASGRYTFEFWQFFGARWAPIDAENDPRGLNRYWVDNVALLYNGSTVA